MNVLRQIIDEFPLDELIVPDQFKDAVRPAVEYLLDTSAHYTVALRLAALMLESYKGELQVAQWFADQHPDNRVETYSAPEVFLAFYLKMLAAKAENIWQVREEKKVGKCSRFGVACIGDQESCSLCKEKADLPLSLATYSTVPPFHVGCRCGLLLKD